MAPGTSDNNGNDAEARLPSAETRLPSAETRLPSAETRLPSAETRLPAAETRLPTEALLPLPQLTDRPAVYSGCCLALSTPLVAHVHALLPPTPAMTLSVGSGFGLLEALLAVAPYRSHVVGVEVGPSPNAYLPAHLHRIVHGTRFLEPLAAKSSAWLFVYPRRVGLVHEYLAAHGCDSVQTIVWIGPHADWADYKGCFTPDWKLHTQSADAVGGRPWELVALAERGPAP